MVRLHAAPSRQRGVAYFWALLIILLITLGLGKLLDNAAKSNQRARELELLYVGNLYRHAIRQYSESTPAGARPYPDKLEDLLRDPRYPVVRRYLRRLYPDPVTGQPLAPILAPEGGVMGVHSASSKKPLKVAGFAEDQAVFAAAPTYRQWEFSYVPNRRPK
ncbi:type II secretion system protein [Burkholderia stagnalis]|uniref:type II secretion system protein n=1 Tax=Burkholderia stagnalis TaxID=1503054 RepID=UPI000F5E52DE|nr:type II secretion system protein [Burkholderia stagnalis]RQX88329.1 type II secretion system protein [Burkholderia stagnalis]RQY33370.1 type II secretion system protein [Burkholderia stagnalis]RQY56683.1 type II secretion system protein [Burkholderia stagnalis]RQY86458.1 type II secretion system protein [Burkholderia stagnalis]